MHFFVSKHFLVSLPVPWPVQKQGCFMAENIPAHTGSFRPYQKRYRISAGICIPDRNQKKVFLSQSYEFRSIPAGTDGKSRTSLQTGMRYPLLHFGENFGLFRCVSGIPVDFSKFRPKSKIRRACILSFFFPY